MRQKGRLIELNPLVLMSASFRRSGSGAVISRDVMRSGGDDGDSLLLR